MRAALRRHASTLVLAALTAAAAVGVLVIDRGSVTTGETRERRRNLLPVFRGDDVSEIRIREGDRSGRVFRGDADALGQRPWRIEIDGVVRPAEEMAVDQLLGSLRDGTTERKRLGAVDADERRTFGLDAPRGEIRVAMGKQRYHVILGGPAHNAPEGAIWAEVEGQWAAVITAQLAAALEVGPDALRRKALVTLEPADLDAISLDGAGGLRHLVRAPWRAPRGLGFRFDGSGPEGSARASGAALDRIWDSVDLLKADAFPADADADRALGAATDAVTLTLTTHAGKKITIRAGGACPGHPDDAVAVRREEGAPQVSACVPRGALEALSMPASDLVDHGVIGARADEVIDVRLQQGSTTLALARSGSQWHEQAPADRPVDPEVGRAFLERLLAVQGSGISTGGDLKALGLDPPVATVRVASLVEGKEDRMEQIEVGAERDGVVHVRRLEDGVVTSVPAPAAAALLPDPVALRGRKVLDLSTEDFQGVKIVGPLGTQRFERTGRGPWFMAEPKGLAADSALLSDLLGAVASLSAERWIGAARPEYGLDHPRMTLSIDMTSKSGSRTVEIALGAPSGSGSFARVSGDAAVFVAPHHLEAAAGRWIIDRTALLADVERLTRVTITAEGGKKITLAAEGGALHAVGGPSDPARAAAVRDALADLVAEGAVSVGPPLPAEGLDEPVIRLSIDQPGRTLDLRFGARDAFHGESVYYARRDGFAATFAVAESRVKPLLDAVR